MDEHGGESGGLSRGAYAVVKHLVLLLHARHEGVFGQGIRTAAVLVIGALDLVLESLDVLWQETMELEFIALSLSEGSALVQIRRVEQRGALAGQRAAWAKMECGNLQ